MIVIKQLQVVNDREDTFAMVDLACGHHLYVVTDEVIGGNNQILAGNLDIYFMCSTDMTGWKTVEEATKLYASGSATGIRWI